MLLAIDVGNTNIVIGVFDADKLVVSWRLTTLDDRTADELWVVVSRLLSGDRVSLDRFDGVVVSSVVPRLTRTVQDMLVRRLGREPLFVDDKNAGLKIRYESPADVGADRLVNGVAAFSLYGKSKRPVIVVDFGTATTFDAVSADGEYLGGVICPGVEISADALFQRAARLPRVDVRRPQELIGQTTESALQSGLFFGHVAMVEGIVERMRRDLSSKDSTVCVATGGLAAVIAGATNFIDHADASLTLTGLRLVWEKNNELN